MLVLLVLLSLLLVLLSLVLLLLLSLVLLLLLLSLVLLLLCPIYRGGLLGAGTSAIRPGPTHAANAVAPLPAASPVLA